MLCCHGCCYGGARSETELRAYLFVRLIVAKLAQT
jgi:hypothetical protein